MESLEKPSAEKTSSATSHNTTAGSLPQNKFECSKKLYAVCLEREAYEKWKSFDNKMCSRMKPSYRLICEHNLPYPHIHMLYQFPNNKKLSGVFIPGTTIEQKVWSPQKYQQYCKGLDDKHIKLGITSTIIAEEGELRQSGGARVKDLIDADIKELDWRQYNVAKKIQEDERRTKGFFDMLREIQNDALKSPEIIYFVGAPGNGKTYGAYKFALQHYKIEEIGRITINNNFFKVDNERAKCFIIEEFRSSQLHPSSLLQLTDKYGYNAPIKGGEIYLRPDAIYICSIINPEKLYSSEHQELIMQFIRRIDCVKYVDEKHEVYDMRWSAENNCWVE